MEQRRIEFVKNKKCYDCGLDTSNKRCITCYLKIISSNIFRTEKRYKELQELFDKQNGLCNYTGRQLILQENCELDHIMPKAKGGSNSMDNLQWLHRDINKMKHDLTEDIFFASIKEISNHTLLESRIQTV